MSVIELGEEKKFGWLAVIREALGFRVWWEWSRIASDPEPTICRAVTGWSPDQKERSPVVGSVP